MSLFIDFDSEDYEEKYGAYEGEILETVRDNIGAVFDSLSFTTRMNKNTRHGIPC